MGCSDKKSNGGNVCSEGERKVMNNVGSRQKNVCVNPARQLLGAGAEGPAAAE
jgi:hypothetical protein